MNTFNKKFNISDLIFSIIMLPLFQPDYFKVVPSIDNIYIALKAIALGIAIFLFLIRSLRRKMTKRFSIYVLLYCISLGISTYSNNMPMLFFFKKVIECWLISTLIEEWIIIRRIFAVQVIYRYLYFLILINFILLILFPFGLVDENALTENYKQYFLSIKNGLIPWMLLTSVLGEVWSDTTSSGRSRVYLKILYIIITITMIMTRSSTGIISWVFFMIYAITARNTDVLKGLTIIKILPWLAAIFILVVFFPFLTTLIPFFQNIFNKSGTVLGRMDLWHQSINLISQKPLIGYGIREIEVIQTNYGRGYSSHNFILYLILCGGFISFLTYMLMLLRLCKVSDSLKYGRLNWMVVAGFCTFFIATLTESGIYNSLWFMLFTLIANLDHIDGYRYYGQIHT